MNWKSGAARRQNEGIEAQPQTAAVCVRQPRLPVRLACCLSSTEDRDDRMMYVVCAAFDLIDKFTCVKCVRRDSLEGVTLPFET